MQPSISEQSVPSVNLWRAQLRTRPESADSADCIVQQPAELEAGHVRFRRQCAVQPDTDSAGAHLHVVLRVCACYVIPIKVANW